MAGKVNKHASTKAFKVRLSELLGESGLPKNKISQMLGVSSVYVSHISNTNEVEHIPSEEIVNRLAELFGFSEKTCVELKRLRREAVEEKREYRKQKLVSRVYDKDLLALRLRVRTVVTRRDATRFIMEKIKASPRDLEVFINAGFAGFDKLDDEKLKEFYCRYILGYGPENFDKVKIVPETRLTRENALYMIALEFIKNLNRKPAGSLSKNIEDVFGMNVDIDGDYEEIDKDKVARDVATDVLADKNRMAEVTRTAQEYYEHGFIGPDEDDSDSDTSKDLPVGDTEGESKFDDPNTLEDESIEEGDKYDDETSWVSSIPNTSRQLKPELALLKSSSRPKAKTKAKAKAKLKKSKSKSKTKTKSKPKKRVGAARAPIAALEDGEDEGEELLKTSAQTSPPPTTGIKDLVTLRELDDKVGVVRKSRRDIENDIMGSRRRQDRWTATYKN